MDKDGSIPRVPTTIPASSPRLRRSFPDPPLLNWSAFPDGMLDGAPVSEDLAVVAVGIRSLVPSSAGREDMGIGSEERVDEMRVVGMVKELTIDSGGGTVEMASAAVVVVPRSPGGLFVGSWGDPVDVAGGTKVVNPVAVGAGPDSVDFGSSPSSSSSLSSPSSNSTSDSGDSGPGSSSSDSSSGSAPTVSSI